MKIDNVVLRVQVVRDKGWPERVSAHVYLDDCETLIARVRELEARLKNCEFATFGSCPFCSALTLSEHQNDCEAFTPTGEVK